jgi:hypothetical protein
VANIQAIKTCRIIRLIRQAQRGEKGIRESSRFPTHFCVYQYSVVFLLTAHSIFGFLHAINVICLVDFVLVHCRICCLWMLMAIR